ncbi:hypothetical protein [Paenibacillus sp. 2TAB19]|uniref:hypothetical protein n=1 Tax=Paenibacillus sp. 2TAB19 TaxID=3233003 RepID=UPI003F9ABF34
MEAIRKPDLKIVGIGSTQGGEVGMAKIEGIGRVKGSIRCTDFVLDGIATISGSLESVKARLYGTSHIEGNMLAKQLELNGKVTIDGDLIGDFMEINGMLTVKGKCEMETFRGSGRLHVGLLNAGTVELKIHGNCSIGEIGGERISIRKGSSKGLLKWLKTLPVPFSDKLSVHTIEGDDIHVEYTKAKVVRGNNVTIGAGCEIELVEYKEKFVQDKSAHVGSKVKQ